MILLFLLAWTWDRVLTDCHSQPETVASYHFKATTRENVYLSCLDDQGQLTLCLTSVPSSPLRFGPDIPDPGVGDSVSTLFDPVEDPNLLPTPAVGALAAWPWFSPDNPTPVVAVDAAGNESGVCP